LRVLKYRRRKCPGLGKLGRLCGCMCRLVCMLFGLPLSRDLVLGNGMDVRHVLLLARAVNTVMLGVSMCLPTEQVML